MWTGTTVRFRQHDIDHGIAAASYPRPPMGAVLTARTQGLFGLPVDMKASEIKATPLLGLPPMVPRSRSKSIHPIPLTTLDEPLGFNIACIHQMGARQQFSLGQCRVNRRQGIVI